MNNENIKHLSTPVSEAKKVPCYNCQGSGCPVCGGSGFVNN